jgi:hypothetical protein
MPSQPDSHSSKTRRCWRIITLGIFLLFAVFTLLLVIHIFVLPIVAWLFPALEPLFYELAVFGVYRETKYVTFNVTAPRGNMVRWNDACGDGLVFFAPFGLSVQQSRPLILDSRGELVWAGDSFDAVTNFNAQVYRNEIYLTFWAGNKHGGEGSGAAYMLDSSYKLFKKINAVGQGLRTDIHEFSISNDGQALISTINETTVDMKPRGALYPKHGWIEDSVFQAIDIDTGRLAFQWRSSDHFGPEDSLFWNPIGGFIRSIPYDFFHLNSVQKDRKGNYLISSRHLQRLLYVDGRNGSIIWTLGGRDGANDFADMSNGLATDFLWQHHARWHSEEGGILTLMDNGAAGPLNHDAPYSKALMLKVNQQNRSVEHLHSYTSLGKTRSRSQGSVEVLPNGNVFVGWGPIAAWSEYDVDGELLCEYVSVLTAALLMQNLN